MKKWKQRLSALLALVMVLALFPTAALAAEPGLWNFQQTDSYSGQFADVPSGEWYASSVQAAYELGLMKGNSATEFNPTGNISIAETLALACRVHSTYNTGERDLAPVTGGAWYQNYVDYAVNNGIISAGQYSDYGVPATRAQFASILSASLPDAALPAINSIASGDIPDVSVIADYAPAVYRLYNAGILAGNDSYGTFTPANPISRAESAAIVTRMADPNRRVAVTLTPSPTVTLYADDGRTVEVKPGLVDHYLTVGWHQEPIVTMYALDGRTLNVRQSNVAAQQKVGWYLYVDYICALAESWAKSGNYSDAVDLVELGMLTVDGADLDTLTAKRVNLLSRWQSAIGCPVAILGYDISYNSIGVPEVNIEYRNLTSRDITAFETKWTCIDAYGNVTTDWPTLYNGDFTGYMEQDMLYADEVATFTWTLYSNERTASIRNCQMLRVAFADGGIWQR